MYKASNQAGQQHGYIRTSDLSDRKKYRRVLKAVSAGELVKVRHGVYAPPEELLSNMVDVESIVPGGVVCLYNAWAYYGLTTVSPPNSALPSPQSARCRFKRRSPSNFSIGRMTT